MNVFLVNKYVKRIDVYNASSWHRGRRPWGFDLTEFGVAGFTDPAATARECRTTSEVDLLAREIVVSPSISRTNI